jgi:amidase
MQRISVVDVVKDCRARIAQHNTQGRKLRAIIAEAPETRVLEFAQKLDEERAAGKLRSPLHGTPIIVKVRNIWPDPHNNELKHI